MRGTQRKFKAGRRETFLQRNDEYSGAQRDKIKQEKRKLHQEMQHLRNRRDREEEENIEWK